MSAAALVSASRSTKALSADELCRVVRASGWSAARVAGGLDRILRHDSERGLLEVQAGVPWAALGGVEGAAFFSGTVGEAVAENRPGPDGHPLVAHLGALTLATPDGQLRRATRDRAPELFGLAVGGFGAFGPFYSLTLDLASLATAARSAPGPAAPDASGCEEGYRRHRVELLLPPERAQAAQSRLQDAIAERRPVRARIALRHALVEHVTVLRWARRDYALLQIDYEHRPTLAASVAAAQLHRRLIELSAEAGGSFMPASLPYATRALAEACYPRLGEFLAERRRLDPGERAGTPWARDVERVWRGEPCRVRFA